MKILYTLSLFILSIASHHAQDGSTLLYKIDGAEIAYPRLSKDDTKILYQSDASGHWQLLVMDLKNQKHTPVMLDSYNNNFPDWSPDNEWIAFTSDRDGNEEIYIIKNNGSGLKRITNDPGRDIHPYFSPDGKFLLFNSTRGNESFDVFKYDLSTEALQQLTNTTADETCARFDPSMKNIVILKNDSTSDDIYIMDAQGQLKNVTNTPYVRDGWPMFSYDGQWIYYSSMEEGTYCVYKIRVNGRDKTRLTRSASAEEDARVSVSHDGQWFIYNKRLSDRIEIRKQKCS